MKATKGRPVNIELTKEQWIEIYYAVTLKASRIRNGDYCFEGEDKTQTRDWAAELEEIGSRIAGQVKL